VYKKKPLGVPKDWAKLTKSKVKKSDKCLACLTGRVSNILVLDFDLVHPTDDKISEARDIHFDNNYYLRYGLGDWPQVKTRRGMHIYFLWEDRYSDLPSKMDDYVDIQGNGKCVYFPPTKYEDETGKPCGYEWWLNEDEPLKPLPEALFQKLMGGKKQKSREPGCSKEAVVANPIEISDHKKAVVNLIAVNPYLTERDHWMKVMWAMRKEGFPEEFAREISQKADNYSDEGFDNVWQNNSKDSLTMGTLNYYARESDEKAYLQLFAQKDTQYNVNTTHFGLAEKFNELVNDDLVYQADTMYIYSNGKWVVDKKCELTKRHMNKVMVAYYSTLITEVNKAEGMSIEQKQDNIKKMAKGIECCQNNKQLTECVGALKSILAEKQLDVEFDVGKEQYYNIQFNNGVFDLKTKKLRKRLKTDYVTQILNYDYIAKEQIAPDIKQEVESFFQKLQPDVEQRKFTLSYLAYCITGNTGHQIMKCNIGYSASNGKSTEVAIHQKCFPIYTVKLDKRTFNTSFEKRHKQFLQLVRQPIRLAYIEELDRKQLDVEVVKDVVDGKDLEVELLYGTKVQGPIQAKLLTNSNKDMNAEACPGVLRRIKVQFYNSRFIDGGEQDDYKKHIYLKVDNYEDRFDQPEYKNAYLHLLLEYSDKLVVPNSAKLAFETLAADYDEFGNILENKYEITKEHEDTVSKTELEGYFDSYKYKWSRILPELKRMGLTYDRLTRMDGARGVIHGLKKMEEIAQEDKTSAKKCLVEDENSVDEESD
jgi:hypothetical protein